MAQGRPKGVLFLGTGNYYRSRFAEVLFNSVAGKMGLPLRQRDDRPAAGLPSRGWRPLHRPSRPDKMKQIRPGTDTRVRRTWYRIQPARTAFQLSGGDWTDHPAMTLLVRTLVDTLIAITMA